MSYYILPKINNNLIVNPKFDNDNCTVYCSFSLYNYYNSIKSQIDSICLNEPDLVYNYNELIKIVNPYEYVFFTVPGSKYSVSKLKPNTNDFYDLLEIFMTLNILDLYNNLSVQIPEQSRVNFGGKRRKTIKGRKGKRRQTNKRKRT